MCGATALADFQTPVRLTPIISSHCSSVSSQNGAWVQIPALAMRMSILPELRDPARHRLVELLPATGRRP